MTLDYHEFIRSLPKASELKIHDKTVPVAFHPNCAKCKWSFPLGLISYCKAQGNKVASAVWNGEFCNRLYEERDEVEQNGDAK